MYSKMLAPVELDENACGILQTAARFVDQSGGTIYVIHVVKPPKPLEISAALIVIRLKEEARAQLNVMAREYLQGVGCVVLVRPGFHHAPIIVNAAKELRVDLIMMATHGRKGVARRALGSVAEHVVRRAPCRVLTLRREPHPLEVETTAAH